MNTKLHFVIAFLLVAFISTNSIAQSPVFSPGMTVTAFDNIRTPDNEPIANAIDGDLGSKFLNFDGNDETGGTAFNVDLGGKVAVASIIEVTYGNDAPERDPGSVIISGSSNGTDWTQIADIAFECNANRNETKSYNFTNTVGYSHYQINFATKCNAGEALFQIMEVQLYDETVFIPQNPVITSSMAVFPYSDATPRWGQDEGVYAAFDGNPATKWLDQDKTGAYTGFTIDLDGLSVAADQLMVTTAASAGEEGRDPATYEVLGSTDGVNFTSIATGDFVHTSERGGTMYVQFTNTTAYTYYQIAFPTTHEGGQLCQAGEVQLYATTPGVQGVSPRVTALDTDVIGFAGYTGSGEETVSKAFDNDYSTKWLTNAAANSVGVVLDLNESNVVATTLRLTTANDTWERDPLSFIISGSTDGDNFVQIATNTIPEQHLRIHTRDFAFSNTNAYSYYKIEFPLVGTDALFQIQNIDLLHDGNVVTIERPYIFQTGMTATPYAPRFEWGETSGVTESPDKAYDNNPETKFFNGAAGNEGVVGFTVDLDIYSAVAKKLVLRTANDDPGRDPLSYEVYGSNDGADFTLIGSGDVAVNFDRYSKTTYALNNSTSYSYYRILFPTRHDENKPFQIAEANLLHDGVITDLVSKKLFLTQTYTVTAFAGNDSPPGEGVEQGTDNDPTTKWLNFDGGANGSGFTAAFDQAVIANSFIYITGNDVPGRDAENCIITGSNDDITYTSIADVMIPDSDLRGYARTLEFNNTTAYKYYKISFPTTRGDALFQVMDFQLLTDSDTPTDIEDFVKEKDTVSVYPNPAHSVINVDLGSNSTVSEVVVYNTVGSVVYVNKTVQGVLSIDVSKYTSGLYFVKIVSGNKIVTKSVIVK
ncbi:discoidin domain-containing protein [Carboxylicivirga marina]|uniref:discoidin domain-containing protein n=1 Tax=Carboxylicivirga marina TaxID=2800988 RepID=UPI002595E1C2|nr:discoidin domain-containing protein [uncultured Carboxylicivirga sp.]